MRILSAIMTVVGITLLITVCVTAGASRPLALLGATLCVCYFGFHTWRGMAYERQRKTPEFVAEHQRAAQILQVGADFEKSRAALGSQYTIVADSAGLSVRGICRVVDLESEAADVRVEVDQGRIRHVAISPNHVTAIANVLAV